MLQYDRKYQVNIFNTDLTGRLSAGTLFGFFEDIAGRHAVQLGWGRDDLMTGGNFWVLSRMLVKIERLPETWEEVTLRTWPRGTETIFALRDLEMYDTAGKRIAAASSSWVIVDYHTRKAQRPDKALSNLNISFPSERALETNARRVPPLPEGCPIAKNFRVRLDDIDINRHVNNAKYVHWAVNSHDQDFISRHTPVSIEVNYLQECPPEEMITTLMCSCGTNSDKSAVSGKENGNSKNEGDEGDLQSKADSWHEELLNHTRAVEGDFQRKADSWHEDLLNHTSAIEGDFQRKADSWVENTEDEGYKNNCHEINDRESRFIYSVTRDTDRVELCRLRISWKKNDE